MEKKLFLAPRVLYRTRPWWYLPLFVLFSLFFYSSVQAQAPSSRQITGSVADAKGNPLLGVTVSVKGTPVSVTTSVDGKYSIAVTGSNPVLEFTYVGHLTREEKVGTRTSISITMTEGNSNLDEVVVIGYGQSMRKKDVGAAISSVNAKEIAERQPVNLVDALQGRAAGVLIMNDNGEPGAQGSIQVRGANTLSADGNTPLYVVDGVITDNALAINPNDIERVEVLKDAASASIYGARSAAGVILITTKKGKEGKPRVDLQYSRVFGKLAHKIQQANAAEYRRYRKMQGGNLYGSTGTLTDSLNPSFNTDNDLQDLLLGNTAQRGDLKLSMSGGQKGMMYYGSLNYIDDKGIALNTWYKSIQSRINTEFRVSPRLKYSNNLSFFWSFGNFTSINSSIRPVFDRPSYLRIYNPDGTLTSYLSSKRNPVANALLEDNTRETLKAQMNHQIDYEITKDLRFTASFNAQLTSLLGFYFAPRFLDDGGNENFARNDNNRGFNWLVQGFVNYSKKFGEHSIVAMAGVQKDREKDDRTHLEGKNFVVETSSYVKGNFMDNLSAQNASASAVSTASAFGRVGYSFKERYIFQGTYRRDASSRFHPDNRVGNFFAGSLAWRFSDEKWMNWAAGPLSDGKLRFSWGQTGNDRVGNYEYLQLINQGSTSYNNVPGAILSSTFGNKDLSWEATEQRNLGLDLSFFNGRVTISTDYYIKTTHDLLYPEPLPSQNGFSTVKVNVGAIETRGFEFQMSAVPVTTKNFSWNVSGNITFERGKIKSLEGGAPFITGKWLIQEGGKLGNFYGWKRLGIYPTDVHNAYDEAGNKLTPEGVEIVHNQNNPRLSKVTATGYTLGGKPYTGVVVRKKGVGATLLGGDAEWEDINNDGEIDDRDMQIIGNAQPDFYLGVINNFNYKGWSLSVIVNATIGGQVYNSFKQGLTNFANTNGPALPEAVWGAWVRQGQEGATYPYFPDKDERGSQRGSGNTYFLEDASFIRLSSARLAYRFKPDVARKAFMNGASVYVYGINLLTWTDYTGFDPEFSSSNALQQGDDNGKYPKRREVGVGVNFQF
jgi:TonB-linked SusC/RagA family outer membrane protein